MHPRLCALLQPLADDTERCRGVAASCLQARPFGIQERVGLAKQLVLQRLNCVAGLVLAGVPVSKPHACARCACGVHNVSLHARVHE
eukprot:17933-Chlamydomonas_euryale.AAC.8